MSESHSLTDRGRDNIVFMRECELLQDDLERRLRGELGATEGFLLAQHLEVCELCRQFIRAVHEAEDRLADLNPPSVRRSDAVAPPAALSEARPERQRRTLLLISWLAGDGARQHLQRASERELRAYELKMAGQSLRGAMWAPARILGLGVVASGLAMAVGGHAAPVLTVMGLTALALGVTKISRDDLRRQLRSASSAPQS